MPDATQERHWIGFDLGGTKMFSAVYGEKFLLLGKHRTKTKGHEGSKAGLQRIKSTIRQSLEDAGINDKTLHGIGIGCPGPLDLENGILENAPNLGWENVPVKKVTGR